MVSVYNGTERKLYDSHAIRDLPIGAVVLDSSYYNDEFGVDLDGSEKEVLIF
jgi:CRISPR-associated endonuclease/helicase Cas3